MGRKREEDDDDDDDSPKQPTPPRYRAEDEPFPEHRAFRVVAISTLGLRELGQIVLLSMPFLVHQRTPSSEPAYAPTFFKCQSKSGRTSAPRRPQAWQVNRGSRSDTGLGRVND
jgi:hypothetical protein